MYQNTCLFVGFSAQDYNFRRIIKNSDKTQKKCYILFTVDDLVNSIFKNKIKEKQKEESFKENVLKILEDKNLDDIKKRTEIQSLTMVNPNKSQVESELLKCLNLEEYAYEKLLLMYLIYSQTLYWEKNNIYPIWTTLEEMPQLIKSLVSKEI